MEKLNQLLSNKKVLIGLLFGLAAIILVVVVVLASLLMGDQNNQEVASEESSFKGTSSGLSGATNSYSNLKGLTLRINQIDTCNPSVVSAYVSVSTEEGKVNKNFGKEDVKIYLDGKEVTSFDFNAVDTAKLPLANMLTIDHSGSMKGAPMKNAKSAAISYVDNLKKSDQVGVIQFDDRIDVLAGMSTDKTAAKNSIDGISPRGDTAIYDALERAIDEVPDCGRKAVTVLSDGDDTASKQATEKSVIAKANKVNLPIFAVGIKGEGFDASSLRSIAEKTGGQYLEANTPEEVASLYSNIDSQLTGQFAANLKVSLDKTNSTHTLKIVSTVDGSNGSERQFVY